MNSSTFSHSRIRSRNLAYLPTALLFSLGLGAASAQDRNVIFGTEDPGIDRSIPTWGLDTAWLSANNVRRGTIYMGQPQVDVIRFSFTGETPVVDGELTDEGLTEFNDRMWIVDTYSDSHTALYFNNDTEVYDPSYLGGDGRIEPVAWANLINVTRQKAEDAGRDVISIAPYNEPDNGAAWNFPQGSMDRLGDVCWQLRNSFGTSFDGIRLYGASTLNNDAAAGWYNTVNGWGFLEEGCTHQLAGSFDSYAAFMQDVSANGDVAANDELHNVMEAMVGAEYGMTVGIWWETADYARGEFVKASDGKRLGYAEHRPNWTAASVYRSPDGEVLGFVGESERQAVQTTYRFLSKDRPVFYDGHGPQRAYSVTTTGGPGYMTEAHRNAEKMVKITWGDDVQPAIDGRYYLVNRNSGKVLEVAGGSMTDGANIQQNSFGGEQYQQWDVTPIAPTLGWGDYNYFSITSAASGKAADLANHSFDDGANVGQWTFGGSYNQLWFLEYVEDGWFYIRNRWSGKYLDVAGASTDDGANAFQWSGNTGPNQQWRLVPATASSLDFAAPTAPTGLAAAANDVTVDLSWNPGGEPDLAGYEVLRSTTPSGPYEIIARGLTGTSYTDRSVIPGTLYYYVVKADDESLNRSVNSLEASATPGGNPTLVTHLGFDGNANDDSGNLNHGELFGPSVYGAGKVGTRALMLGGSNSVMLPDTVASHDELTVAGWVWWNGGDDWQRIFDFGNGTAESLFLTPKAGGAGMRFEIYNGTNTIQLNAPALATGKWIHVAVTLGNTARLFLDGVSVAESGPLTIRPSDINPTLNLIGDSQWETDPLLNGRIDDFRVYNYELSSGQVATLATPPAVPTGTVARWNFEDGVDGQFFTPAGAPGGSGGSFDSASGTLMRGFNEVYGPTWTNAAPPNGGSLAMSNANNQQDAYVDDGALFGWAPTQWTIECTVLLEELAGWKTLISLDGSSQGETTGDFYLQKNGIDGKFRVDFDTVGGTRWILDGNYVPQVNTWYALAARCDGTTLSLWLDDGSGYQQIGSLDISAQSVSNNAMPGAALAWTFGRGWYDGAQVDHIDGRMDNIRFSNSALSPGNLIPLQYLPLPSTPSGLAATVNSGSGLGLSWAASVGATSYNVKRSNAIGGPFTSVATGVTGTGINESGLVPGTSYFYTVSAVNPSGESADSGIVEAATWTIGEEWRFAHFGTIANAGDAADTGDPDMDGVTNLLERAFGGDPNAAEHDLLPKVDPAQPMLSIIYRKAVAASDLQITVVESTNLNNSWIPATGSETPLGEDAGIQQFRFTRLKGLDPALFLRIEVSQP